MTHEQYDYLKKEDNMQDVLQFLICIDYPAYDGEGWEFRQYDTEGRVVCDSGHRIYTYENSILEKIAQLLP